MQVSYSRVGTFKQCPYKFKLKYKDLLEVYPNYEDASNALYLGSALHLGIEKNDIDEAIKSYYNQYPIITDKHIEEAMKLEYRLKQCLDILPKNGLHETKIEVPNDFIGFIDLLVPRKNKTPFDIECFDLYDFKYSNNVDNYLKSQQLHVYKWYFEKLNPNKVIMDMYFLFVPKVNIKQKKTETMEQFRMRIREELDKNAPQLVKIDYDKNKVVEFLRGAKECRTTGIFPKAQSRLCDWCEYQRYCESNEKEDIDIMQLPKNERVASSATTKRKMWIYGAPFSGKTHLANEFPNLLLLSTDGNYRQLDGGVPPHIDIVDEVKVEGRRTIRTLAWQVLKDAIDELEKKQNDFDSIALDLVEDGYEHCRIYMYDKLGITHEGDDPYKAWDKVRTEFLSTMKRFFALDYENLIIISHEDTTKDVTKKSGDKITSIKPNLQDKPALKLSGMVDIVMRTIAEDENYTIEFKKSEVVFGGGRLNVDVSSIPNTYNDLISVYNEADKNKKASRETSPKQKKVEEPKKEVVETATVEEPKMETPERKSRTRKARDVVEKAKIMEGVEIEKEVVDEELTKQVEAVVEDAPKRRRRRGA